jgi:glycosyltransferase involved in cell wall biosynthesis
MTAQIAEARDREDQTELERKQKPHARNLASSALHIIIPVLNEEAALRVFLPELSPGLRQCCVVVDNGSEDRSAEVAAAHGVRVVREPRRGYGAACLAGIAALHADAQDIVIFIDGDASDDVADLPHVVGPLENDTADLVIGSRTLGARERGALTPHARFGNWLAATLILRQTGVRFTDLGPLRAIRYATLQSLAMQDRSYGWTVEMQLKAVQRGLRIREVPVHYRKRVGRSKISGTLGGSLRAGFTILHTIKRYGR